MVGTLAGSAWGWMPSADPTGLCRATLVLRSTLTNDGAINNNGTIGNAIGKLKQCNEFSGNPPSTPGNVETPGVISTEEQQCLDLRGNWSGLAVDTCIDLGSILPDGDAGPLTVNSGEVLTVRNGTTYRVSGTIVNIGSINIEETGAMYFDGTISGLSNDAGGTLINYGLVSLGFGDDTGNVNPENNGGINNNGGAGSFYGEGYINNFCGAVFDVNRALPFGFGPNAIYDETCPDPDTGDDVNDAFPYDITQTTDTDNDGFGDNLAGNAPTCFP